MPIPQHQDMLNACTSGNATNLQRLFEAKGIKRGSKPIYIASPDDPPPANDMLEAAIANGHLDIVVMILNIYDDKKIQLDGGVVTALVNHPDMAIMEVLYSYDNDFVHWVWDDRLHTFLTEAFQQPPDKITPLLLFLIENGATVTEPDGMRAYPLTYAILGGHTLEVIEAIMKKGGGIEWKERRQAIISERPDVIESFMRFGVKGEQDETQDLLEEAEKTGVAEVIKLTQSWTSSWEDDGHKASWFQTVKQKLKQPTKKKG